ncbi:serine hydrolase domain-containing protein [Corynebacterium cystitidis]|uniref:CubicO group peptidase, beta-lactamase class C family n=1 Tax=Corynebacterium cystitidis DSM 20524 TaxID=1121357 RepID=A0A1H9VNI6_9CORY|nr:serine hydrolase domain-containing protein [Corynebacterium cystitidis]WJY82881.1 Penicillin-binding protein 4* [Corynebacterium cystitidis DSM 20524]SES23192.1 CubicO group peptidase, beta-lactamase class C family [Corynebacterium cystitidis DSM 20524]SNV69443.1 beta-lactamase class C [Corynebacterium cystitidis]
MDLTSQLTKRLGSWPPNNVAAAIVGTPSRNSTNNPIASYGDQDRVFELMSVTKLLATYAFLMAVEEGALELDQPAGPEGSTVRHLLAHASGVAMSEMKAQKGVEERRIYSSAGFDWLAQVLEEESGITIGDYAREGVFAPLGMGHTEIWGSPGHDGRSSASDLTVFARELLEPTLLAEETVREAFTVQFPELIGVVPGYGMQKPNPWGLGFEVKGGKAPHWTGDNMPADTVGHFGMSGTYLWVIPTWSEHELAGTAMVCLTDKDFGDWAKPLWQETNTALVDEMLGS